MLEQSHRRLTHYTRPTGRRSLPAQLTWRTELTGGPVTQCLQTPASCQRPDDHSARRTRTHIHTAVLMTSWVVVSLRTSSDSTYTPSAGVIRLHNIVHSLMTVNNLRRKSTAELAEQQKQSNFTHHWSIFGLFLCSPVFCLNYF